MTLVSKQLHSEVNEASGLTPRAEARRRAIIEAAGEVFLEVGYGRASMADIVRRSGGSLATLYALFGNKEGLFRAIVEDRCAAVTAGLETSDPDERPPAETLTLIGRRLLDLCTGPEGTGVVRMVVAEGAAFPELGPLFFEAGPHNGQRRMARYLDVLVSQGRLEVPDTWEAAGQLCGAICHGPVMQALCGLDPKLEGAARDAHVRRAVDAFLAGYRPVNGGEP